ncbi:hypothetical protein HHK36_002331 [Tetracentron sinense]|uniref:PRA1 family protein n=1 Tax=Tetracentron sinense TaxID=13715 RepID=A0A834ZYU3_TETSI|nr:hypothetical protein HHK36_002331 [Tetracentron sinense]
MQSPSNSNRSPTTYTTIPISGNDVISRSFQNISAFISCRRPWPEFIAAGVFDRPESLSYAGDRLRKNANYFRLNYAIIVLTFTLLSLVGNPLCMLLISAIFALWLILYFFREDPLFVRGHHLSDRVILVGLIAVSAVLVWFTGVVQNMIIGVGTGLVISAVHGVFRNPDGLFLDENEAVSRGLIGSGSAMSSDQRGVIK